MEYHVVINISIGAHEKVDLELKNKSLKKSKVIIDSWYASGGKKFFLQDKFKLNSVFRRGGRYYNLVSPPSGLREKFTKLTPGYTGDHHRKASSRHVGNTNKLNPKNISRLNDVAYFEYEFQC